MHILPDPAENQSFKGNVIRCVPLLTASGDQSRAPVPCDWTLSYDSLIAEGKAAFAQGEEKKTGMDLLMAHYGMQGVPSYRPGEFSAMQLLKVSVLRYTAKQYRGSDDSSGNYNLADHSLEKLNRSSKCEQILGLCPGCCSCFFVSNACICRHFHLMYRCRGYQRLRTRIEKAIAEMAVFYP